MMTAGATWIGMLRETLTHGSWINDSTGDYAELQALQYSVEEASPEDPIFKKFVDADNIKEMEKVFLSSESNRFGHSYGELICGGKEDQLEKAIGALKENPLTRKAVIVLGSGGKSVPCINALHFYLRNGRLHLTYFARGQDLWVKFVPDLLALRKLQERVASGVAVKPGIIRGLISSAHIYLRDKSAAELAVKESSA